MAALASLSVPSEVRAFLYANPFIHLPAALRTLHPSHASNAPTRRLVAADSPRPSSSVGTPNIVPYALARYSLQHLMHMQGPSLRMSTAFNPHQEHLYHDDGPFASRWARARRKLRSVVPLRQPSYACALDTALLGDVMLSLRIDTNCVVAPTRCLSNNHSDHIPSHAAG